MPPRSRNSLYIVVLLLLAALLLLFLTGKDAETPEEPAPSLPAKPESLDPEPPLETQPSPPVKTTTLELSPQTETAPPKAAPPSQKPDAVPVLNASMGGSLGLQIPPLPRGTARIQIEEGLRLPKNLEGHYQRVHMSPNANARIQVAWSGIGVREVIVHAIHGGRINGKTGAQILRSDAAGKLNFHFQSNSNAGRYDILLRSGPTEEVLHFWIPTGHPEIDLHGI